VKKKVRTRRDEVYLQQIRQNPKISRVQLLGLVVSHPLFTGDDYIDRDSIRRDIDRFVGNHIGKSVSESEEGLSVLSSPTQEQEFRKEEPLAAAQRGHCQRLLRFYLDEKKQYGHRPSNGDRHTSFLRDFRYRNLMLQHLETGYPAVDSVTGSALHGTFTKWDDLERQSREGIGNLQKVVSDEIKAIGETHNVRPFPRSFGGLSVYYYEEQIVGAICTEADLSEWKGFTWRELKREGVCYVDHGQSAVALLRKENEPAGFARALNRLAAKYKDDASALRACISERDRLDGVFQTGFQGVLDEAELAGLKGACDKCPTHTGSG
jgi:hypothetical protein